MYDMRGDAMNKFIVVKLFGAILIASTLVTLAAVINTGAEFDRLLAIRLLTLSAVGVVAIAAVDL